MDTLLIGTLEGLSSLRVGDTLHLLTPLVSSTALDPLTHPINALREREGQVAVVKGERVGNTIFGARIVEILPPIASEVTKGLLAAGVLTTDDLQTRTQQALQRLVGNPAPPPPTAPSKLCALVVGHRLSAKGTRNVTRSLWEFDFNNDLAPRIQARVTKANVQMVLRDDNPNGYTMLPSKINQFRPHFIVSLHCNGADTSQAHGTEMLYYHRSTTGHKMALALQRHVLGALGLRNRFTKARTEHERGGSLLKNTAAPCVITEPFFMTNENDMQAAVDHKDNLIAAYAAAIDEIAETII